MVETRVQRRLTTILAADVVGYSRLMEQDEAGTMALLRARRQNVLMPLVAQHGGRVFKLMGDCVFIEFTSVVSAVECAVDLQKAMQAQNADMPTHHHILLRIGINLGDVIVEGSDLYGDGVNLAARLESLADPGGICISGDVYRHVRSKLHLDFQDLGEQKVKNITEPVHAYRVQTDDAGPGAAETPGVDRSVPAPTTRPSIAVLPFTNMSGDAEQEYFSDGISEDIITDLSKLSELHVIARNSSFVYKHQAVSVPEVARTLGVRYVLEGSVRKAGNRVRVTAQLIDSTSGGHAWADRFDRDLTDIFAVQDELTHKIVAALKARLTADEQGRLMRKRKVDIAAYEHFLRGREQTWLHTRTGNISARGLLGRAVAIDPGYAAAHACIAFTHVIDYVNGWVDDPERSLQTGLDIAQRAVEMDEEEPQGHFALAVACTWNRELERALAEGSRCLALLPNSAEGHLATSHAQIFSGHAAAALEMLDAYMRLDPLYPDIALYFLAEARFLLGEFAQSAAALEQRLERNPQSETSYALLASCYGHLGRLVDSRTAWEQVLRISPGFSIERRRRVLPFRNPEDFERRVEGLRKAGLPV